MKKFYFLYFYYIKLLTKHKKDMQLIHIPFHIIVLTYIFLKILGYFLSYLWVSNENNLAEHLFVLFIEFAWFYCQNVVIYMQPYAEERPALS